METELRNPQEARSLRSLIEAFFRHSRLFLGVLAVVLGMALLYAFMAKRQYESEMKMLIQNARSNSVLTADRSSVTTSGDVTEQQINSELELLMSQDVLSAVADPEWRTLTDAQKTSQRTHLHEDRISKLGRDLTFQNARKSNVLLITSMADTPKKAAEQLRAVSSAYLDQRKLLSRPGGTTSFFAEESARYKAEWDKANAALVDFQQRNHMVSVPDTETSLKTETDRVQTELSISTTALAESDRKLHESILALTRVPQRQPTQERTLENQGAIQTMRTLLVTLNNKRTELLTRYAPTDRLVTEIDQQISDTNTALRDATSSKGRDSTTDINPVWQQLKGAVSQEQVNHGAIESKIRSLNQTIANLHGGLASTQQMGTEYNGLKANADQAQSNYKLFAEKHDQAQIEDAMDLHQLVNVAIAENPTLSFKAASPRPFRLMLLSTITALGLAIGSVAMLEFTRSTVANARELEASTPLSVLASLPFQPIAGNIHGGEDQPHALRQQEREPLGDTATLVPVLQHLRTATER